MHTYSSSDIQYLDEFSSDNGARYTLGKPGRKPLIVIGLNPNTATPTSADATAARVDELANLHRNVFDGWIILNVYPERTDNPLNLPRIANRGLCEKNIQLISKIITKVNEPTILVAFGEGVFKKDYLLDQSYRLLTELNITKKINWLILDPCYVEKHPVLTVRHNMPRHLSPRKSFTLKQAKLIPANEIIELVALTIKLQLTVNTRQAKN